MHELYCAVASSRPKSLLRDPRGSQAIDKRGCKRPIQRARLLGYRREGRQKPFQKRQLPPDTIHAHRRHLHDERERRGDAWRSEEPATRNLESSSGAVRLCGVPGAAEAELARAGSLLRAGEA